MTWRSRLRVTLPAWMMFATLACVALFSSEPASAHVPVFSSGGDSFETALRIDDIHKSTAFYGEVEPMVAYGETAARFVWFQGDAGEHFYFQMNVPDIRENLYFCPDLFLFGPGLSPPNETTQEQLDIAGLEVPSGDGVVRFSMRYASNGTLQFPDDYSFRLSPPVFEPFGQVYYFNRYEDDLVLPASGVYHIAVVGWILSFHESLIEREQIINKYLLVTGNEEIFGIKDYVLIPIDWIMIRTFWDWSPLVFMMPTLAVTALGMSLTTFWMQRHGWRPLRGRARRSQLLFFIGLVGSLVMIGGAVNQLLFLFGLGGWSSEFAFNLVLAFQSSCFVLGLLAYRLTWMALGKSGWPFVIILVVLASAALVLGAGFIVGPALFLAGCALLVYLNRGTCDACGAPQSSDSGKA